MALGLPYEEAKEVLERLEGKKEEVVENGED